MHNAAVYFVWTCVGAPYQIRTYLHLAPQPFSGSDRFFFIIIIIIYFDKH